VIAGPEKVLAMVLTMVLTMVSTMMLAWLPLLRNWNH
jgi:hypothetical protein